MISGPHLKVAAIAFAVVSILCLGWAASERA
jgi:hypothetical protein